MSETSLQPPKKRAWEGLIPKINRFLHGGVKVPKLRKWGETGTPTDSSFYEGMDKHYRWFRQDELVRKCVVTNAIFATMVAGFETELELTGVVEDSEEILKKYAYLKEEIDAINKTVNLDQILFVSQVKRSIYGHAGWEIIFTDDSKKKPKWLLSLQSPKLKPKLDDNWTLTGYTYEGKEGFYKIEEMLYLVNLSLESDRKGLSDIECIVDVCKARHDLLRENFPEIMRTIWAPYVIVSADTSGMSPEAEDKLLDELMAAAKSGKSIVVNKSVEVHAVKIEVNLAGLVQVLNKLEEAIQRPFGTPRFLLGKPIENRATAYAELEAYVGGPVAHIQRYLKRALESDLWYDKWARHILKDHGVAVPEGEPLPVTVKHKWKPIRVTDVYEMAKAVAALYAGGLGILGPFEDLAFDMMAWPLERLQKELEEREKRQKEPTKPPEEPAK